MSSPILKLYHPIDHAILAEIRVDRVIFFNKELEDTLKLSGISIPFSLQSKFEGKKIVFPGDRAFPEALKSVYYPYCLHETGIILAE